MRIHVVHGIRVDDINDSIGKIIPYLRSEGHEVLPFNYGYTCGLFTRFKNTERIARLMEHVHEDDIVIAHSNGCTITHGAIQHGAPIKGAVYINPALNIDEPILNRGVKFIHIYHHEKDRWVSLSRLLWFHPWGRMGQVGYRGKKDARYKNFNMTRYGGTSADAHSFVIDNMSVFQYMILSNLQK